MMDVHFPNTIAAIATALGAAGVGIVRISGPEAVEIARRLLPSCRELPHRRLVHVALHAPNSARLLDEGFACAMYGPHSFTGEDVVELQVHGGVRNLVRILEASVDAGARLAEPGEFTRRAVLNGRIDLTRAEALRDVIGAASDAALDLAHAQRSGVVADAVQDLARALEDVIVRVEADLDFPDEDGTGVDPAALEAPVAALGARTRALAATWETGRRIREGFRVVLAGAPNVGKSSLFNALLADDRAIVTETPGTTRDFLEESLELRGLPFVLVDTAGLRAAGDAVEKEGVARAERQVASADLVLALLDGSRPIPDDDLRRLETADRARTCVVLTKGDLPAGATAAAVPPPFGGRSLPVVSAKTGAGLDDLRELLVDRATPAAPPAEGHAVVSDLRHRKALERAAEALDRAVQALAERVPLELAAADLRAARRALGEIVGEFATEDLLDRIFGQFCIGK